MGHSPCVYLLLTFGCLFYSKERQQFWADQLDVRFLPFFNYGRQTSHQHVHGNLIYLNIHSLYIQILKNHNEISDFILDTTMRQLHLYKMDVHCRSAVNLSARKISNGIFHMVEIDWDQPGEILSPGCPHHPCLSIPGTRRLPVLSPIKKYGWWNKNGCCHLYCGSGHFHHIKIIVNGSNMTPFHWN